MKKERRYFDRLQHLRGRFVQTGRARVRVVFGLIRATLTFTLMFFTRLNFARECSSRIPEGVRAYVSITLSVVSIVLGLFLFLKFFLKDGVLTVFHSKLYYMPMQLLIVVLLLSSVGSLSTYLSLPARAVGSLSKVLDINRIGAIRPLTGLLLDLETVGITQTLLIFSFLVAFVVRYFNIRSERPRVENGSDTRIRKRIVRYYRKYFSKPNQKGRDVFSSSGCSILTEYSANFALCMAEFLLYRSYIITLSNNASFSRVFGLFSLSHVYVFTVVLVFAHYELLIWHNSNLFSQFLISVLLTSIYLPVSLMGLANSLASEWAEFQAVEHLN